MESDSDELEIYVVEEIAVPDEAALEHPSVARIKESEGIPVRKYKPVRVKSVLENKPDKIKIVSVNEGKPYNSARFSNMTNSNDEEMKADTESMDVENMSLEEVIAVRKNEFVRPASFENMSLSEIIRVKKERGEISCGSKRVKTNENEFLNSGVQENKELYTRKVPAREEVARGSAVLQFKVPRPKTRKFTPEAGLRILAEKGFLIVWEVSEMKNDNHPLYLKRRWRACYYDGRDEHMVLKGVGEGPRKALAKAVAALDFIENLRIVHPELKLPECEVPKGCRISPYVMVALETLCGELGLNEPLYTEDVLAVKGQDSYKFSIHVGGEVFSDLSYDLKFAKYKAAKKAYDALQTNGEKFPFDPIIRGEACIEEAEFVVVESDEIHVMQAKTLGPKKVYDSEFCSISVPSSPVPSENEGAESGNAELGRSSPASVTSSSTSTRRIKVASVGEPAIMPRLMKIRRSIEERKFDSKKVKNMVKNEEHLSSDSPALNSGSSPQNGEDLPFPSEKQLSNPKLKECNGMRDEVQLLDEGSVMSNGDIVDAKVSKADPRLKRKLIRSNSDDQQLKFPQVEYIRDKWVNELKSHVVGYMNTFEDLVEADEEALRLESGTSENSTFRFSGYCNKTKLFSQVMIFSGHGYSSSFRLANMHAKSSLQNCVRDAKTIIFGTDEPPAQVKVELELDKKLPKRVNPFWVQ